MTAEVIQVEQTQEQANPNAQTETTQATQTAETTTTATETTANTETATNTEQPNYEWLNKYNIKSETDLSAVFEKERQLQEQLEQAKQTSTTPYKTDFAKVADELTAKGVKPETIARFHGLKADELDSRSSLLLKLELEMPTLTPQERLSYFEEKYAVTEENENILTDGQKALRKVELEREGANAREFLKQYVFQALNPNQVDPTILAKEEGRQNFWKQEGIAKVNALNEIKMASAIDLPTQNGVEKKEHDFTYQITEADKQALLKEFNDTVLNPAYGQYFDNSEKGIAAANKTYENMFWQKHGPEIARKQMEYTKQRESLLHEHYSKLINNTSFKGLPTDATPDKSVSADKGLAGFLRSR